MLAAAEVVNFFAYELSRLSHGRFARTFGSSRFLNRPFLRHVLLHNLVALKPQALSVVMRIAVTRSRKTKAAPHGRRFLHDYVLVGRLRHRRDAVGDLAFRIFD